MRHQLPHLLVFLIAAAAYLAGGLDSFDTTLMDLRFRLDKRTATDQVVVVAINESSLQELDVWPWPRRYHARVVERLLAAGAKDIVLDIDFSSRSSAADDEALAAALSAAGSRAILPVFRQLELDSNGMLQEIQSLPLASFRQSTRVASFNVRPDPDGIVRRLASSDVWGEQTVPAFAALAARLPKSANDSYYVDFGIDPKTIRHLSYADVLAGRFEPDAVAGKLVLVGATAVQLGDMVTVPVYRALPGIVLQALAFQSLAENRAFQVVSPFFVLIGGLLIALLAGSGLQHYSWRSGLAIVLLASMMLIAASFIVHSAASLFLAPSTWILTLVLAFAATVFGRVNQQDLLLLVQGLAMRRRNALMKMIVDNSFDAILTVTDDGDIRTVNPAAEAMFGYRPDELVGRNIRFLLKDPQAWNWNALSANAFTPGTQRVAASNRASEEIQLDLAVSRMNLSDETLTIVIARDVSQQVEAERVLIQAKELAELSNRSKTEFLHNMSHELRTPLNAIIGFSEIMQSAIFGPLGNPKYLEYAGNIQESGRHLLAVINDILDIAKIESGRFQLAEDDFDLEALIASTFRLIRDRAVRGNVAISMPGLEDMPRLRGDSRLIKQALLNLLDNAVKFTPSGGQVHVAAGRDPAGGVRLSVRDTGIGIPADQIPRAMEPFGQVDGSLNRKYEGTGLGLPLAKRFLVMHGGDLVLESEVGRGTTATISLPASRVLEQPPALRRVAS